MGFLKKHPIIISLILFFIAVQLFPLIYKSNDEADPVTRTIMWINYYPYKGISSLSLKARNLWHGYFELRDVKKENTQLKNENDILRSQLFQIQEIRLQNKRLKELLGFIEESPYNTISAGVIGGSPSLLRTEFLVLDKGKNYGIEAGMPVVTQNGIVGRVHVVNDTSSQVMLITDPISAVDAQVQRTRARGVIKGDGEKCIMEYLDISSDIDKGDKIISSGKDGYYPAGILIGEVRSINSDGGLINAEVVPEVSVNSLDEVLVIKSLKK